MQLRRLLAVAAAVLTAAVPAGVAPVSAGSGPAWADVETVRATSSGPRLTVPLDRLRRAVRCSDRVRPSNPRRTVLLVHGTASTAHEAWGWGYERQLAADGFGWCDVQLPRHALGNLAVAAQYVVHAARVAHRRSGRRIALVGHSQGGALVLWAAKFWPDVGRKVSDVVPIAAPLHGTTVANALCATGRCAVVAFQLRQGSRMTRAMDRAPMPRGLMVTSVATRLDELITPQPYASQARGVRTILVQDICPGHVAEHGLMLGDPVGYDVVVDAITHRGRARPGRIDRAVCSQPTLTEADPAGAIGLTNVVLRFLTGLGNPLTWVSREPALPRYARRYAR